MGNLKISKTSLKILLIGIFVVAIAGLGLTRSQQIRAQNQVGDDLTVAQTRLDKLQVKDLNQQVEDLQARLDQSKAQLGIAKDKLRQTVESTDVTDKFFQMAKSGNVAVMSISSAGKKSEKQEGINTMDITLDAVVTGAVPDLINFVIKLNTDFTTGIVEQARISIPEGDAEIPTLKILMVIYSYKGD